MAGPTGPVHLRPEEPAQPLAAAHWSVKLRSWDRELALSRTVPSGITAPVMVTLVPLPAAWVI